MCTLNKIEALPFGQYIVRIIKPSENRRLEKSGHTLIYIKEEKLRMCYDPNSGLKNLGVLHDAANLDFIFRSVSKEFELSHLSCFRVEPLSFL
ncbi:MAG: putative membrane protein [Circular genetic element sp.]|nr:MAG: putative membrane protein [Circular genetic element sp.]